MGQVEIHEILKKNKEGLTSSQLSKILGTRQASVSMSLRKLIKSKLVIRKMHYEKKSGRQYIYKIKNGS